MTAELLFKRYGILYGDLFLNLSMAIYSIAVPIVTSILSKSSSPQLYSLSPLLLFKHFVYFSRIMQIEKSMCKATSQCRDSFHLELIRSLDVD